MIAAESIEGFAGLWWWIGENPWHALFVFILVSVVFSD